MKTFVTAALCLAVAATVSGIEWNNCGSKDDPASVHGIDVQPDPIKVSEVAKIAVNFSVSVDVNSPTKLDLVIEREFMGKWVKIPCLDGFGSCSYDDACIFLPKYCPKSLKICKCPLPKGDYEVPPTDLDISQLPLPAYLEEGKYRITGTAYDTTSKRLLCLQLFLTLSK